MRTPKDHTGRILPVIVLVAYSSLRYKPRGNAMTGKTALVTGASGGLGTHVTKALLDAGFAVVGLAPKIRQADFDHPNFTALPVSLDSLDAAKKAADTVIGRFGK